MQYVFIFQALLEHYLYGDTELEVTSLESHLAKLYSPSPGAGCNGLEAEFKVRAPVCCIPPETLMIPFVSKWVPSIHIQIIGK